MAINLPKISIVIPVFNGAIFLEAALLSVINQDYKNTELIIIDGGSTDGTLEIIKKYSSHLSYWESVPDNGQTHALNKGFSHANGDILSWLNSDEEYLPQTLKRIAEIYISNPSVDLVYGGRIFLDITQQEAVRRYQFQPPIPPFKLILYTGRVLFTDATFWTKSLHQKTGALNVSDYPRYAMDVEWLLRISGNSRKSVSINDPLSIFKFHGNNITAEGDSHGQRFNEKIRLDYARKNNISRFKFFCGWFFYSLLLRYIESGIMGIFTLPKISTVTTLFSCARRK